MAVIVNTTVLLNSGEMLERLRLDSQWKIFEMLKNQSFLEVIFKRDIPLKILNRQKSIP